MSVLLIQWLVARSRVDDCTKYNSENSRKMEASEHLTPTIPNLSVISMM